MCKPIFVWSIYLLDWLFWLTKAGESKCTTCYAAEVCQASNTCSLSDAYFIMAPLSQESRHLCVCVFFFLFISFALCFLLILCSMFTWILSSFSLPLPHCLGLVSAYLQLSVVSPSISIFLPLVCPFLSSLSPPLCVCSSDRQASKRLTTLKHTRQPQLYGTHTPHTPIAAPLKPPSFICEQRLNREIRADQLSAPCGLLFILNFLITLALAYSPVLDANMQRHSDKQTSI